MMTNSTIPVRMSLLAAFLLGMPLAWLSAQDAASVQRVTVKDNVTVAIAGAGQVPLKEKITFPFEITIFTNATYKVGDGRERTLAPGEVLNREGELSRPDGSVRPVYDHLFMNRGRVELMRDGNAGPLSASLRLADGTRVSPDGFVTAPNGTRRLLLDGQILRLDGSSAPAKDTVTLLNGRVRVQKDGTALEVRRGTTLMMSNNTKVFGDGYLLKPDGSRVQLSEGQTIELEGVVVRR